MQENCTHSTFMLTFFYVIVFKRVLLVFFCIKQSYQIQIIFKQIYLTHKDNTTLGQSEPGSKGNEEILHTLQRSITGSSSSDAVYVILRIFLFGRSFTPLHGIHVDILCIERQREKWLVGCVLLHINPCRLFNVKSCSYAQIKYIICE